MTISPQQKLQGFNASLLLLLILQIIGFFFIPHLWKKGEGGVPSFRTSQPSLSQLDLRSVKGTPKKGEESGDLSLGSLFFQSLQKYRTKEDLEFYLGISPKNSDHLARYVKLKGPPKNREELSLVPGFSLKKIKQIENQFQKGEIPRKEIYINRAGYRDLLTLKGMDSRLANRIIGYRSEKGGFTLPSDLMKIPGINLNNLKNWHPYIRF